MVQVPQGIITQLAHPPYGLLSRETAFLLGPGVTQLQRIRGPVNVDAFGIAFSFITIPAGFGRRNNIHVDYENPIVIFAPLYTLFDGHDQYGDTVEVMHEGDLYYLGQLFPKRIDVWVAPGCTVQQYFVLAL